MTKNKTKAEPPPKPEPPKIQRGNQGNDWFTPAGRNKPRKDPGWNTEDLG